jgi:hypothetical protein
MKRTTTGPAAKLRVDSALNCRLKSAMGIVDSVEGDAGRGTSA